MLRMAHDTTMTSCTCLTKVTHIVRWSLMAYKANVIITKQGSSRIKCFQKNQYSTELKYLAKYASKNKEE